MSFFFALLMALCVLGMVFATINIRKINYAQRVLDDVYKLLKAGVITDIQAKVFLKDLDNPLDKHSVQVVRWSLDEIVQKELIRREATRSHR